MNFDLNGLVDSVLPNVYINKITLERKNSGPLVHNKNDMSPHIDQSKVPEGETSLLPKYGIDEDILKVTFNMFLEIPHTSGDDLWDFLFDDDIINYLDIKLLVFSGKTAKEYYMSLINQKTIGEFSNLTLKDVTKALEKSPTWSGWDLKPDVDFKYKTKSLFNIIKSTVAKIDDDDDVNTEKLNFIKQKYQTLLPNGTTIYKIPITMSAKLSGGFTSDLSAIAVCSLDQKSLEEDLFGEAEDEDSQETDKNGNPIASEKAGELSDIFGRIVPDVIINNGEIQNQGMMFVVSEDQQDSAHEEAFAHLKGQLWLGSAHKSGDRYMVGNEHVEALHPYLDYVIVPSTRIQDFRQVETTKKQLLNFNPITNSVFGGNYTDFRSNTAAANFDDLGTFSNLISSIGPDGRIKLFFSIDWGKLIKKNCAVPALLDKAAVFDQDIIKELIQNKVISLKIFRERIGVQNAAVSDWARELVYDAYPNMYYFKLTGPQYPGDVPLVSSLVSISFDTDLHNFKGAIKNYSFTDYEIEKISEGKFKYSVEIEFHDPTVDYFTSFLVKAEKALSILKKYVALGVNQRIPDDPTRGYFNSYLGKFNKKFVVEAKKLGFNITPSIPEELEVAMKGFQFIMQSMRTKSLADINTEGDSNGMPKLSWAPAIRNMLNPDNASPDSITTVFEIFDTLTSQVKSFIESFASVKIPKTGTGKDVDGNIVMQNFTKMPIGSATPEKKISVKYNFDDLSEIVDATQMEAGQDFFGDVDTLSPNDIGLKLIDYDRYNDKSTDEDSKYFAPSTATDSPEGDQVFSVDVRAASNDVLYAIGGISTKAARGRFFTVPPEHVNLPNNIKGLDEDNNYWQIVNNIIRYKFGLLGNYSPSSDSEKGSFLGYGVDKIPGSEQITPELERVLKEYQSLSYIGAVFSHQYTAEAPPISDPLMSDGSYEPSDNISAAPQASMGFSAEETLSDPLPSNAKKEQEITTAATITFPWAKNIGQERFLLSLIMKTYFNLGYWDIKLGTFNPAEAKSRLGLFLNKFFVSQTVKSIVDIASSGLFGATRAPSNFVAQAPPVVTAAMLQEAPPVVSAAMLQQVQQTAPAVTAAMLQEAPPTISPTGQILLNPSLFTGIPTLGMSPYTLYVNKALAPVLNALPNQIKVLIMNNNNTLSTKLNSSANYTLGVGNSKILYDSQFEDANDATLFIDRFGDFWFKHQNLVEVEYLSGYEQTSTYDGEATKYETVFNSSIKSPVWTPLTTEIASGLKGVILCRLRKYKNQLFNKEPYNILDLPIYNEYFFLKNTDTPLEAEDEDAPKEAVHAQWPVSWKNAKVKIQPPQIQAGLVKAFTAFGGIKVEPI